MMYPDFKSKVRNDTGELASKFPSLSHLYLIACEFGNLDVIQYLVKGPPTKTFFLYTVRSYVIYTGGVTILFIIWFNRNSD